MKGDHRYHGHRNRRDGTAVVWRVIDGHPKPLPLHLEVDNHSPTGFEWGYGGSGPAQLALALLVDVLKNRRRALRLHQQFKFAVIANLPCDADWTLTRAEILDHVAAIEASEAA